ncbi:hypothetical protein [Dolichospermum circinale]|uniref:Uncharacterized protein n=1 Tax=Dolichospermum circinale CS-537/01 TaxID=3021739 RepID=A0ABT5A5P0_9CYAN|nr:hypothetical protein [Dolichospermum circinale]MDB9465249.1 hypothetical protein [Dolichospermum circinale CS-539/09]MDB9471388.1 hypothetical protein [Dolichospermum circinale CS-539]MDB9486998.1 hypothetical protein [Dolichospermum circinale CS-537/01]
MTEKLQDPNWDKFTPEQKRLYEKWIQSLEAAIQAHIELMKSFESEDSSSESSKKEIVATPHNTNFARTKETLISLRINGIDDIYCEVKKRICKANCLFNSQKQKCLEDCERNGCS